MNEDYANGADLRKPEQKATTSDGEFRIALKRLLNNHSMENASNTPDFILAQYLVACLHAFDDASKAREKWYGLACAPGGVRERC